MYRWVCLLVVLAARSEWGSAQTMCGYEKCEALPVKEGYLNVHLVPHTHDDVGWLKTVDQYYYGANNSIQTAGVQYILDSVIPQLEMKPSRTFIYVEMAFFARWWREQDEDMQERVKKLVNRGQLEFINGGWCMNDEAGTHYNAIIDQMSLGLQFLDRTFGACGRPLVAWHIDPFGHSREQASLFAQMGFDGFFFARLDYQDKDNRLKYFNMEEIWKASPNDLKEAADLFTGALYNHYGPPDGLCFDIRCKDQPIEDDGALHDFNVAERVKIAENRSEDQMMHFRTNHIMWTMGSDFQYQAAHTWFKNMDKLIKYTNSMTEKKVNLIYSSPSCYVYHKNKASAMPPVVKYSHNNTADFFPYADSPHAFWSGYFTSRPALKGYVRRCNNLLQVCKQLEVIGAPKFSDKVLLPTSEKLREATGVAQHHDAVSGTEKQHVANDYAMRLHAGAVDCQMIASSVLQQRMVKGGSMPPISEFCNYLNVSICPVSEGDKSFTVTVYNPLARMLTGYYVRLPVNGEQFDVVQPEGTSIVSQVLQVSPRTQEVRGSRGNAKNELLFEASAPAMGFRTYIVSKSSNSSRGNPATDSLATSRAENPPADTEIHNEHLSLVFDGTTGLLKTVMKMDKSMTLKVNQGLYWYNSSAGNNKASNKKSGAYLFRPNGTEPFPILPQGSVITNVVRGDLVQEVHQMFGPWATQVVRLYPRQRHAELEWTVGPIPFKDDMGKEVISRFDTDIMSKDMFYTDANGREILAREVDQRLTWKLNQTEPVAGNYYPVNSRIYIKDSSRQLTIMTDRSQGGSSLKSGSVELMVHRRMLYDDGYGAGEPLNETGVFGDGLVVRGKHYLLLDTPEQSGPLHRALGEQLYMAPAVLLSRTDMGAQQYLHEFQAMYTSLNHELPASVHLLTLEMVEEGMAILRLENQFQMAEGGSPQKVSLMDLFKTFEIDMSSVEELTLGANLPAAQLHRLKWNTESGQTKAEAMRCWDSASATVSLNPMQICTLRFKQQRK